MMDFRSPCHVFTIIGISSPGIMHANVFINILFCFHAMRLIKCLRRMFTLEKVDILAYFALHNTNPVFLFGSAIQPLTLFCIYTIILFSFKPSVPWSIHYVNIYGRLSQKITRCYSSQFEERFHFCVLIT